jgi:hypothetical protein
LVAVGGRLGVANSEGVAFYNRLIDALLQKGIISQSLSSSYSKLHVSHKKSLVKSTTQIKLTRLVLFKKKYHQE